MYQIELPVNLAFQSFYFAGYYVQVFIRAGFVALNRLWRLLFGLFPECHSFVPHFDGLDYVRFDAWGQSKIIRRVFSVKMSDLAIIRCCVCGSQCLSAQGLPFFPFQMKARVVKILATHSFGKLIRKRAGSFRRKKLNVLACGKPFTLLMLSTHFLQFSYRLVIHILAI